MAGTTRGKAVERAGGVRLQKFLADCGVCSRRAAERMIADGMVSVNRETATLGQKVEPGVDRVVVNGQVVASRVARTTVLVVNKPAGISCDARPPEGVPGILSLVPAEYRSLRLRVAGELETEAEGLVVLSDDGDLIQRLVHPSGGVLKRYLVRVREPVDATTRGRLERGFVWEGVRVRAERITPLRPRDDGTCVDLIIDLLHGRKREVRRLFDCLYRDLRSVRRIQIGSFLLKRLPLRVCRALSSREIGALVAPPEPENQKS